MDGVNLSEEAPPISRSDVVCPSSQYIFPERGKSFEKEETSRDALKAPLLSDIQWNLKMMKMLDLSAPELKKKLEVLQMKQPPAGGTLDSDPTKTPHHLSLDLKSELGEDHGH